MCRPLREDSKTEQNKIQQKGKSPHIETEWHKPSEEKQSERQAKELRVLPKDQANTITYIQRICCRSLQKPMSLYETMWALLSWFGAMISWCLLFPLTPQIILHDLLLGSENSRGLGPDGDLQCRLSLHALSDCGSRNPYSTAAGGSLPDDDLSSLIAAHPGCVGYWLSLVLWTSR